MGDKSAMDDKTYQREDDLKSTDGSRRATPTGVPAIRSLAYTAGSQSRAPLGRVLLGVTAVAAAALTALTFGSASAQAAFPFPTNGKIACGGLRGSDADLEIFDVNPNGSGERLLTDNGFRDSSPAYSPDGTKIAFESGRARIPGQGDNPRSTSGTTTAISPGRM